MPKRRPERDKARELFLERRGKVTPKELGEILGVQASLIRKWKSQEKWDELVKKRKRGGQPGNRNAKGNKGGAPKGNRNAETHGAYSIPRISTWSEEEREILLSMGVSFDSLADSQLKRLLAKQHDLEKRISDLCREEQEEKERLYLDRVTVMELPGGGEMKYRSESTAFARRMTLEGELNKVHGRLQKLLDSIRAREDSAERMKFDRERFEFSKQKALGAFSVDEEGRIDTTQKDEQEIEIIGE